MTIQLGILLALACAISTNLAFLLKHRGAGAAPAVRWRRPVRTAAGLFRSRWFAIGMAVALAAWVLHVGALAMAPLSLVQTVIAGGLVFLAVLADRLTGFQIGRRQWWGVAMMALGLALLAAVLPEASGAHSRYSLAAMISFESALLGVGTLLVLAPGAKARQHHGAMLAIAAGLLFGVSDVAIKALTAPALAEGPLGLISPWLLTALLASAIAFYASASSLQKGEAVPVIALTSAAANISAISGGIIVFGDPLPGDALGIVVQALAFLLVIAAAALTPAPRRATAPVLA